MKQATMTFAEEHALVKERLTTVVEALREEAENVGVSAWEEYETWVPSFVNWGEESDDHIYENEYERFEELVRDYLYDGLDYPGDMTESDWEGDCSIMDGTYNRLQELIEIAQKTVRERGQAWAKDYPVTQHCSAELRESFQEWLDSEMSGQSDPDSDFDPYMPSEMFDLAFCCDILPADYCVQLDIPRGSNYAQALDVLFSRKQLAHLHPASITSA